MVIFLELHFYITYFKDYSISTSVWVCACITCICEPMCVCKYMPMMPMHAAVETRGYGVSSFCTFSTFYHILLKQGLSVNLELTILTRLTCLSNFPSSAWTLPTHLPSPDMYHHAQHYLVHGYWGWGWGSEFRPLCLSR